MKKTASCSSMILKQRIALTVHTKQWSESSFCLNFFSHFINVFRLNYTPLGYIIATR
jgi:hypothetical protein